MSDMRKKLPFRIAYFFVIFGMFLTLVGGASASIFDGGGSGGSGGVFDGFRSGIDSLFDGIRDAFPGGAVIPGLTPTPVPAVPDPIPPESRVPVSAGAVRELKLTLEWDALSLGGETMYPQVRDPLACIHLGDEIAVDYGYPECAGKGYPGIIACDVCGFAYVDTFAVDSSNRLVPEDVLGMKVQAQADVPPPPSNPPIGGPPVPVAPILWQVCIPRQECMVGAVTQAIVGWCGQDPIVQNTAGFNTTIPISSNGPNSFTLPNAVSNKYIRRDGYAFKCVIADCISGTCEADNYMEFQSMVYPSNAVSMYLNVENVSQLPIENIVLKSNTLSYSSTGETPLPHNLDYLVSQNNTNTANDSPSYDNDFFNNDYVTGNAMDASDGWGYTHGNLVSTVNVSGVDFTVGSDPLDPEGDTIQFQYGPFDMDPGETRVFPYQPQTSEFSSIPHTSFSYPEGDVELVPLAKPCECQTVKVHDILGNPADGCNVAITAPTIDECRIYYGIGAKRGSGGSQVDYRDHAGGYVCDLQGIPVDGCPPSWCFDGAVSDVGPMDVCQPYIDAGAPDVAPGGPNGKIDNPQDPDMDGNLNNEWWFWTPPVTRDNHNPNYGLNSFIRRIVPDFILNLFRGGSDVNEALASSTVEAFGCPQPCDNQPPPGVQGVGGIIPRDYNFICEPGDTYSDGSMVEAGRCDRTDFEPATNPNQNGKTIIPPEDQILFRTYRDVTGIHGCGYNASSNNSVIGPIQVVAEYGGTADDRIGRSVILASIPIGGRILDDQARPYGWPVTGEIEQDWGYTGEAQNQGPYRSDPWFNYGEFRYCSPSDILIPPDQQLSDVVGCNLNAQAPAASHSAKSVDELVAAIGRASITYTHPVTGATRTNYLSYVVNSDVDGDGDYDDLHDATGQPVPNNIPDGYDRVRMCYNDIVGSALRSGNDPALALAIWMEESGASNYTHQEYPGNYDFGCVSFPRRDFQAQLACFTGRQSEYATSVGYTACRNRECAGNPTSPACGKLTPEKYLQIFSDGNSGCVADSYGGNVNFEMQINMAYMVASKNDTTMNMSCVLPKNDWRTGVCLP